MQGQCSGKLQGSFKLQTCDHNCGNQRHEGQDRVQRDDNSKTALIGRLSQAEATGTFKISLPVSHMTSAPGGQTVG